MTQISYEPTWTSISAEITFFGETVGELQDFSLDENFNVQRVMAIGSPVDIRHLPGIYQATVTARRAFIEASKVFSLMTTVDASKIDGAANASIGNALLFSPENLIKALKGTTLSKGVFGVSLNFDIEVKQRRLQEDGTETTDILYTLNDCTINSRSTNITSANVIIFENASMFPRSRTVYDNPTTSA